MAITPLAKNERALWATIDAVLVVESVNEPVSFLTVFQSQTGKWEIHGGS